MGGCKLKRTKVPSRKLGGKQDAASSVGRRDVGPMTANGGLRGLDPAIQSLRLPGVVQ